MKNKILYGIASLCLLFTLSSQEGCDGNDTASSDRRQREQQAVLLTEATNQVSMPAIKNFRERKMLKDILELRDQKGLSTYTYIYNEFNGCFVLLGNSVGYGIPYATQFTNPSYYYTNGAVMPQADPNGLFSPSSAEGTWVLMKNPNGDDVTPVYVEPRILVSTFQLDSSTICR